MKASVLLPNILDHPFTYKSKLPKKLKLGDFVKVPFGSKEIIGVVWDFETKVTKKIKIKNVISKIDVPSMNVKLMKFISWFSKYNMAPLGMTLKMALLNKQPVEKQSNIDFKKFNSIYKKNLFQLNKEQKKSLYDLKNFGNKYNVAVLEGVTGSGKTLVYFERIKDIVKKGSQALVMLPEIVLTEQFSQRFRDFFGFEPAIWHSNISKKKKNNLERCDRK